MKKRSLFKSSLKSLFLLITSISLTNTTLSAMEFEAYPDGQGYILTRAEGWDRYGDYHITYKKIMKRYYGLELTPRIFVSCSYFLKSQYHTSENYPFAPGKKISNGWMLGEIPTSRRHIDQRFADLEYEFNIAKKYAEESNSPAAGYN